MHRLTLSALVALSMALAAPAVVHAVEPRLNTPAAKLEAALTCHGELVDSKRTPVLLVHGTNVTREENWDWSYARGLDAQKIPWCAPQIPLRATGDLQDNVEYVVYATKFMARKAGRRISIVGASQGGMLPRWMLRFWPSTRKMVDDMIGVVPSNHGTDAAGCEATCQPAGHQQSTGSNFLKALNAKRETWSGVSYTNIVTKRDTVVVPYTSGELTTGAGRITNVATQDVCPTDLLEHILTPTIGTVAFALMLDALNRGGPANASHVKRRGCLQPAIGGQDLLGGARALVTVTEGRGKAAPTSSEPPLRCYVTKRRCR